MFKYWCEQYRVIDEEVPQDGVQMLRNMEYDVETLTYGTMIGWFDSPDLDETDVETFSDILFSKLKGCTGFTDKE